MRILFVDDDPEHVEIVSRVVADALDADVALASSVEEAVAILHSQAYDLVVTVIFIPLGHRPRQALGPRARVEETLQHLGGLILLTNWIGSSPLRVLAHTTCTDFEPSKSGERVERVPKPAPVDVPWAVSTH